MAKITTITNPLTGQPAQVDQLDHTAQQIDDGLNIARGVSNPNLLDNWYFGNPVDQRQGRVVKPNTTYYSDNQLTTSAGTTSAYVTAYRYATGTANGVNYASFKLKGSDTAPTYYAAPENVVRGYANFTNNKVYSIDRWALKFGYVIINDGYITWGNEKSNGACQYIQIIPISVLPGKRLSYSIITTNGVYTKTVIAPSAGNYIVSAVDIEGIVFAVRVYCNDDGTAEFVLRKDSTIFSLNLVGIKLELGTEQTLAHQENGNWVLNEIPDYGEQLARCQRYYRKIYLANHGCIGYNAGGKSITFVAPGYLKGMRTTPSLSLFYTAGSTDTTNGIVIAKGDTTQSWSSYISTASHKLIAKNDDLIIMSTLSSESTAPSSRDYTLMCGSKTYITASADL